jgi:phosphate:Na+ symporter
MIVLTDGLRALASNTIHTVLMKFTRTPLSGAVTGAVSTAVLQSSSAMTVAAVGFVGAGLLSYSGALGVIFGANIGTTITGWLVVLFGFKLKLGSLVQVLVFAGAILRLFAGGRLGSVGLVIAGFGLVFSGIGLMQSGMSGLQAVVTPDMFPKDNLAGRFKLVGLGILVTLVTQSSSAGVAMALTALFAGTINFNQAAALVIGMDIGTTATAAMATIGASVESRRTGLSHVIYNLITGVSAVFLLGLYQVTWETIAPGQLVKHAQVALVGFHTSFNLLGVIVVLPLTNRFARMMEKLIPDRGTVFTQSLDQASLSQPRLALTVVQTAVRQELMALLDCVSRATSGDVTRDKERLKELDEAIDETLAYIGRIQLHEQSGIDRDRMIAMMHVMDHMHRLADRCREEGSDVARYSALGSEADRALLLEAVRTVRKHIANRKWHQAANSAEQAASAIAEQVHERRNQVMAGVASGEVALPMAEAALQDIRWMERVSRHVARITTHLDQAVQHLPGEAFAIVEAGTD